MEKTTLEDGFVHAMKVVLLCQPKEGFPRDFRWTKANFVSYKRRGLVTCPKCLRELEKSFPIKPHEQKRKEKWKRKKAAREIKAKNTSTPTKVNTGELPIPVFSEMRANPPEIKPHIPPPPPPPSTNLEPESAPEPEEIISVIPPSISSPRKTYFGIDVSPGPHRPK